MSAIEDLAECQRMEVCEDVGGRLPNRGYLVKAAKALGISRPALGMTEESAPIHQEPVTIVLPTLNAGETIEDCLKSLLAQTYPGSLAEIVVVDGGSRDNTVEIAARLPVTLLRVEGNAPKAMNHGSRVGKGSVVLFADGDAYYPPNWIEAHMATLSDPRIAASGGPCLAWQRGGLLSKLIGYELAARYTALHGVVKRLATMNLAVRRPVLEQAGGFEEGLDVAYDTEFGYRLAGLGLGIAITNSAVVYHANRTTLAGYLRQQYRYARFVPLVFLTHPAAIRGDDVTSVWMNAQPIILAGTLLMTALGFVVPPAWLAAGVGATVLVIMLAGESVRVIMSARKPIAVLIPLLLVARIYAWLLGGLSALLLIIRKRAWRRNRAAREAG